MASSMKIIFGLLTFVTVGMIIGALFQLAFIRKLEDSYGVPHWDNDKEAEQLRLGYVKPEVISWSPRIIVLHNFLSSGECDYLRAIARPRLHISTVVDTKTGKEIQKSDKASKQKFRLIGSAKPVSTSLRELTQKFVQFLHAEVDMFNCGISNNGLSVSRILNLLHFCFQGIKSDVRTSSGMFLSPSEKSYPMIQAIEKRISVFAQIPIENGELIQVLRYEKNQYYKPHHDYFSDAFNLKRGGQRIATMLMYLSDNVEGGETYFPVAGSGECSCGGRTVKGLSVKPIKGDAILFWSMGLDGQSDPKSLHGGCEVLSGEKWSATKWMRQRAMS